MTDHDPEFDAIVEELQRAGFVTIGTDAEGEETWTLTPTGEQIALQLSMSSEDDAAALLEARASRTRKGDPPLLRDGTRGLLRPATGRKQSA